MELDEFGDLFNARFEQPPIEKSTEDISQQLRSRSGTALDRIMRNLLLEVGMGVAAIIIMTMAAYRLNSLTIRWLSVIIWILSIGQIVAFTWQYRKLKRMIQPIATDLRSHLQQQIQVIDRFVKMYLAFCLWSIPVGFVLGGFLGYTVAANGLNDPFLRPLDELKLSLVGVIVVLVLVLGLLVGLFFMIKAYIRWLYGRHLDQLKACLAELDRYL